MHDIQHAISQLREDVLAAKDTIHYIAYVLYKNKMILKYTDFYDKETYLVTFDVQSGLRTNISRKRVSGRYW